MLRFLSSKQIVQKICSTFLLFVVFICTTALAEGVAEKPLSVDQVFHLTAKKGIDNTVLLKWQIKPSYYLYRDRFVVSVIKPQEAEIGQLLIPEGEKHEDNILGKYQIFKNNVTITVPIINPGKHTVALDVSYQGCSANGYCYPPVEKVVSANLENGSVIIKGEKNTVETEETHISRLFASHNIPLILLSFFGLGLLLAFTPCVLPMFPILLGIIVGQKTSLNTFKAFLLSLTYVLSMAVIYAIAGILVGLVGGSIQVWFQQPWILILFSLLFIAMALSLFGLYDLQLPASWRNKLANLSYRQQGGNYIGVVIMGVLSTLIVSPCVTPALVGALSYISTAGNAILGGFTLFVLGLGMGFPLLVIGTLGGKFLPKSGQWMVTVKSIIGILMLGVAVLMLERLFPPIVTMIFWAGLAIGAAIYLGAFQSAKKLSERIGRVIGIILFVYGIIILVGAFQGSVDPLHPLTKLSIGRESSLFKPIKSVADVRAAIKAGKLQKKPIMLDFYADWCVACKELDQTTFENPDVMSILASHFIVLRADVTKNDDKDRTLMSHFNVIAPPTMIFFSDGKELSSLRIVGETDPKAMLKHLHEVLGQK